MTSLSGIANRYVALTPGPGREQARCGDNAQLDTASTTTAVDLDQLFNTLDPEARKDLQGVIEGFKTQFEGKGDKANASAQATSTRCSRAPAGWSTRRPRTRRR